MTIPWREGRFRQTYQDLKRRCHAQYFVRSLRVLPSISQNVTYSLHYVEQKNKTFGADGHNHAESRQKEKMEAAARRFGSQIGYLARRWKLATRS